MPASKKAPKKTHQSAAFVQLVSHISFKNIYMRWQEIFYDDGEAYARNPQFNWVYDKLNLTRAQGVACSPVGVNPTNYPVCVKPITNLFGLSRDAHYIGNADDYDDYLLEERPSGQFWMPFVGGEQYSVDLVFSRGKVVFTDTFRCVASERVFGLPQVHIHEDGYALPERTVSFLEKKLRRYTGPANVEIIGGVVIEMHLRWSAENYMWRRRTEFVRMLPLWLGQRRTIPAVAEDVVYVPCFVDRDADVVACQDVLARYGGDRFKVYLDEVEGDHQQHYARLGVFVAGQDDVQEINLIKSRNNWV